MPASSSPPFRPAAPAAIRSESIPITFKPSCAACSKAVKPEPPKPTTTKSALKSELSAGKSGRATSKSQTIPIADPFRRYPVNAGYWHKRFGDCAVK